MADPATTEQRKSQGRRSDDFSREAEAKQPSLLREFWDFLSHNKKWWLAPIIVILLLFGLLIILAGTGAAPFIYTLF
jgi:hypothetical protein